MSASVRSVELVESEGPDHDGDPTARGPDRGWLRRHPWWVAGATVLLVGVLAVLQSGADAADRERVQALSHVTAMLAPLDGSLEVAWQLDASHAAAVWNEPAAGVIVSGIEQGAAFTLRGTDTTTGHDLWSTPVRPVPGPSAWAWCLSAERGADAVLVCSGATADGIWEATARARPLWVVEPRTGRLLAQQLVPFSAQVAVQGSHLLVARPLDGGRWRIVATDPVTQAVAWTFTTEQLPKTAPHPGSAQLLADDGGLVLAVPGHAWSLTGDGRERSSVDVPDDVQWKAVREGVALGIALGVPKTAGEPRSTVLLPDGTAVQTTDGELPVSPDDGSAAGTYFSTDLSDGGSLLARSAVDGSVLWRADIVAMSALLLDDRLVVSSHDALAAFDARTGRVLWHRTPGQPVTQISTDGRSVVVTHDSTRVEAFAVADGSRAWSTDVQQLLAADIGSVGFYGLTGRLLAALGDGAVVALR